jgi:cell division septal protein FtsQ
MTVAAAARRVLPVLGGIVAIVLLWFGYSWFRDSSLVEVRHVEVSGLTSPDAPAIRRELISSAKGMTTLHVRAGRLERSVSAYPIVHTITASPHFPSTLRIRVHEYEPVALLAVPGGEKGIAVSSDGTLLPRIAKTTLPTVAVKAPPQRNGFESPRVRTLVEVLAGAPRLLRPEVERAYLGKGGILVAMRSGPTLEFGPPSRIAAKWASATRVLAARSSSGATTIDVRLPERPAASGFANAGPANPQG